MLCTMAPPLNAPSGTDRSAGEGKARARKDSSRAASHRLTTPGGERLVALDVFRGLTMAAMVVVNNPGDWGHVYPPLLHAPWHGWTPTDLVFPFFLFMVGVSITLSRKTASWTGILRRTLLLIGIGLFLNAYPRFDLAHLRWPGVLQRIGLCYGAAAALLKLQGFERPERNRGALARNMALAVVGLLLGYWAVMVMVPGSFGTTGDLSLEGNVAARIDRALLAGHIYRPAYDPEGLVSTLPAIGTTLLGVLGGFWLRAPRSVAGRSGGFLVAGAGLLVMGSLWDLWLPINKPLWTGSYVLLTAGLAAMFLGACLWLIDVRGWRIWTRPFVILGRNALVLYVLSGLLADTLSIIHIGGGEAAPSLGTLIYQRAFVPLASPYNSSLLFALANLAVLFVILWWLHRRRLWLRV